MKFEWVERARRQREAMHSRLEAVLCEVDEAAE